MAISIISCPLCELSEYNQIFHIDKQREYWRCHHCQLVFVPVNWHLNLQEEQAVYDLHDNRLDDTGYQRFLSRLANPVLDRLTTPSDCLDYGCGPTPLLAKLLSDQGHRVHIFDPFYARNPEVLTQEYDVITCSEVVEHWRSPKTEFERLFALLNSGGILAIMTKRVIDAQAFRHWHYKNDKTHIGFYSCETFEWIARRYQCTANFIGNDVTLLTRQPL